MLLNFDIQIIEMKNNLNNKTEKINDEKINKSCDFETNSSQSGILVPLPDTLKDGKYQLLHQIGSGGMGRIFLAEDTMMNTNVVIKEMLPFFSTLEDRNEAMERFKREAKILYRLKHNNLPRVTEYFTENRNMYLVMEYVEGEDLETIIEKRALKRITVEESIKWMTEVLNILKYLHNHQPAIIHRDIKPANIMLTKHNEIYLVDFGIARSMGSFSLTRTGTPGFASLEHFTGKYCPASDIYSLGATFHYLLSGDNPINRQDFKFPLLSKYRDDIPDKLQKILGKMLQVQKEDRYSKVEDVLTDLENITGEPAEEKNNAPEIKVKTRKTDQNQTIFKHWKCLHTLEGHSWKVKVAGIPLKMAHRNIHDASFSNNGQYFASCGADRIIKIWDINKKECIKALKGHKGIIYFVLFTPDDKYIISGSKDKVIKIWDCITGECIKTLSGHKGAVISGNISPDGKYIVSGSDDKTVKIWSLESGECIRTLTGHKNSVKSIAVSPDSAYIASGGSNNEKNIIFWGVTTGFRFWTLEGHSGGINSLVFSPNGNYMASASSDETIRIWDADTGVFIKELSGHFDTVYSLSFSPNSKHLASGSGDSTIRIWNVDKGKCIKTLKGHKDSVFSVAFSTNGRSLISGSADETIRIWGEV